MRAIEFSANLYEDSIKVPKRFLHNLTDESLRVIILIKEQASATKTKPSFKKRFSAVKLNTQGFKFSRDEANER